MTQPIDKTVYTGTPWERSVHYSRARRRGPIVAVAGTVAVDAEGKLLAGDAYGQARAIFEKIQRALEECGASLRDVMRTRMYVTSFEHFEGVSRAHAEFFDGIDPVATAVAVSGLVRSDLLVEIEVDAYVPA